MSDDLIKRDDALATIDTFKRNFEQPWKVQFSADIRALPAVDLSGRIEALERERDAYAEQLMVAANTFSEMHLEIEQLRDKISEMQDRINRLTLGGNRR